MQLFDLRLCRTMRNLLPQKRLLLSSFNYFWTTSNKTFSHLAYNLANYRSLISIKGADSAHFLQNLITNDINKLNVNQEKASLYAMMLNDRGRVLYDTIVYRPTKICDPVGTEYLIELDTNYLQKALQFFNVMKFKKKVQIKTVDDQFALFAITPSERSCNNLVKPIELSDATNAHICSDPRHASLGSRLILKVSETNTKANIKISELIKNLRVEENLSNYKKFLYKNGIAENGDDFVYGSSIPLEFNIVFLNGVSFDKGCYLGQELIAKTHHTGIVRKRILPFKILNFKKDIAQFDKKNVIVNTKTKTEVGKLVNLIDYRGIMMARLENLESENMALMDNNNNAHEVKIEIPDYWVVDDLIKKQLSKLLQNK